MISPSAPLAELPWALDDWPLRLTRDQARALTAEIRDLVSRYRREPGDPDPQPGTVRAVFQFQLLPDEPLAPGEPGDD